MYSVMIIDDEMPARKLLYSSIDWESLGLIFAGEASSGIEAINIIDDIKPDIVFVDIFMPFMNGIDFTRLASERYPNLIFIVLTGFDDFEYARQCVSLPVVEYMLKPIVKKDVKEVLIKIIAQLDQRESSFSEAGPDISASSIDQISAYIRDNYSDSGINLTSVATHFSFNSSYLSRKFKQETGQSFVDFLMTIRMEKAKKLATCGKKMFEAAGEVGIPDPNYFGRCFKKYVGVSYSEYKD